ncbi:helix-turn-helix domain-containing protein [Microvirga splendida]|nr:helix-turn-helix domain-containing protein [Microvirga splendida]
MTAQPILDPHSHPEPPPGATTVVFDDHRFCAATRTNVEVMTAPHMHSQFEFNYVLEGAMTYWFDDHIIEVGAGSLVLFWGMIPHQTIAREPGTHFSCLYIPSAVLLGVQSCDGLRTALFEGAFAVARTCLPYDPEQTERWRKDLLTGDPLLQDIVREEVSARLRRLERDGWHDIRAVARPEAPGARAAMKRLAKVELMARFIDEHACDDIDVASVARSVELHPNYAMDLFRRGVGQTIVQYIIRRRLDIALSVLVSTEQTVADIAFQAGFKSLSRFYEAFTSRFGMSPNRYRRHYRQVYRPAGDRI